MIRDNNLTLIKTVGAHLISRRLLVSAAGCVLALHVSVAEVAFASSFATHAWRYSNIYRFRAVDGGAPLSSLMLDASGNLYGTSMAGGKSNHGTVFKVTADGTETVLHSFAGGNDGIDPGAGVIADSQGDLFGTASGGGAKNGGVVFMIASDGSETILHAFGGRDGVEPIGGLIADKKGNLYGTTVQGGGTGCGGAGCGTIFKISPNGKETILYSFAGGNDGDSPAASLLRDKLGNLYGTTTAGGGTGCVGGGCGTVFKLAPDGTETVIYSFKGGASDGEDPYASLIADKEGNLYGLTYYGGSTGSCGTGAEGCGTAFEIATQGTETVLHSFVGGSDGAYPQGGLVMDRRGNLYGTTNFGGSDDGGTVFQLSEDGTERVIFDFRKHSGAAPSAGLIFDSAGSLYGTAAGGCRRCTGVVFKLLH